MTLQAELHSEGKHISIRRLCSILGIPRSSMYYRPVAKRKPIPVDTELEVAMYAIIQEHHSYGLRRLRVQLYRNTGKWHNRKKIHRIIKRNQWQVRKKPKGNRPRAKGWAARPERPNQLWQIDATHLMTRNGWCHLVAIIDTYDRQIVGWRLSESGRADVAAAALEDALMERNIEPGNNELTLRSDNGLVFGAKAFTAVSRRYHVFQEYITPYTPEQNGMIERFFRTAKEELFWQYNLRDTDEAFLKFAEWSVFYNTERPHSALGYQTPSEFRRQTAA